MHNSAFVLFALPMPDTGAFSIYNTSVGVHNNALMKETFETAVGIPVHIPNERTGNLRVRVVSSAMSEVTATVGRHACR